jgi:hypothetical protein
MPIRIPHSSPSRQREKTYAQLILRISRRLSIFEGGHFRTGVLIDERDLHPAADYPATPLLIEYAGTDGTKARDGSGWGHKRLSSVHILWRWDAERKDWEELARTRSYGPEWFHSLAPIVRRELAAAATPGDEIAAAGKASAHVVAVLDGELDRLSDDARRRCMSILHDQFTARLVLETEQAA